MSGVELALAIVPLVIAVIQHRKPLTRAGRAIFTSKRSNEQRNERSDFYSQLSIELKMLHNTLQILTGDVPPGDNEALQNRIHRTLRTSVQVFESILRDILQGIDDIVSNKSLGLGGMRLQRTMLEKLEFIKEASKTPETKQSLRERFLFTKNDKTQKAAMKRIRGGNDRLFNLVIENGGQRTDVPGNTASATARRSSTRTRRNLESSYRRLAKKWPKGCCSPPHHQARLSLSSCCGSEKYPSDGIKIMVSLPGEVGKSPNWQEMSMTALQDKSVRFADGENQPSSQLPSRRDIDSESLCSLLHETLDNGTDLRIALEDEKFWQLRPGLATWKIQQQSGTRLASLLPNSSKSLSSVAQSFLAVILAHAVLHCSDSPWLCNNWSKDHVVFFQKDSSADIEFDHPFLMIDFQEESTDLTADSPLSVHPNPTILALGILLLEIFTQTAIESLRNEQDLENGLPNANTDLTTATSVLKTKKCDVRVKYRDAIQECLDWNDAQLEGDGLRQKIYEKIVRPLERELIDGFPEMEDLYNFCEQCTAS